MGGRRKGGRGVVEAVLSPLQAAFCREYVVCNSAEQAVVKAGYGCRSGGGGNPAAVQASRLLKMAKIQAEIQALRDAAAKPILPILQGKILSEHERKVRLSEIALQDRHDRVSAVDKLNMMDRLYDREPALPPGVTRMRITEIEYGSRRALESGDGRKPETAPDAIESERI